MDSRTNAKAIVAGAIVIGSILWSVLFGLLRDDLSLRQMVLSALMFALVSFVLRLAVARLGGINIDSMIDTASQKKGKK